VKGAPLLFPTALPVCRCTTSCWASSANSCVWTARTRDRENPPVVGQSSLQPVIVPRSEKEAVGFHALCRGSPEPDPEGANRGWRRSLEHAGQDRLPNPNAAIGSVLLSGGPLLLVFNNAEEDRENLSLAHSTDFGNTWRIAHRFEGDPDRRRRGPGIFLPMDHAGPGRRCSRALHLGRSRIKHVRFNRAWLEDMP